MFKQSSSTRPLIGSTGFNKLSPAQSIRLEQPVTMDEVKRAVCDCDGSKAPEPDGFTFSFYKTTWSLIRNEVFHMISKFFRIEKLLKGVTTSYVTSVPKNAHPTKLTEFRLISLIHGLYKIVGKLLLSRLHIVMATLISSYQTSFISGRKILDGFMIANDVIHFIKKRWLE
jgi:hypothetical protein